MYQTELYLGPRELKHYGVPGMKWGKRKQKIKALNKQWNKDVTAVVGSTKRKDRWNATTSQKRKITNINRQYGADMYKAKQIGKSKRAINKRDALVQHHTNDRKKQLAYQEKVKKEAIKKYGMTEKAGDYYLAKAGRTPAQMKPYKQTQKLIKQKYSANPLTRKKYKKNGSKYVDNLLKKGLDYNDPETRFVMTIPKKLL